MLLWWPRVLAGFRLPPSFLLFLLRQQDFLNANAQFDVGPTGSKVLQNCLAYKLCYYRFGELRVRDTRFVRGGGCPTPRPLVAVFVAPFGL